MPLSELRTLVDEVLSTGYLTEAEAALAGGWDEKPALQSAKADFA